MGRMGAGDFQGKGPIIDVQVSENNLIAGEHLHYFLLDKALWLLETCRLFAQPIAQTPCVGVVECLAGLRVESGFLVIEYQYIREEET